MKSHSKSFNLTIKISGPTRRTNLERAIRLTNRDDSLKSMNPADNLKTAGDNLDGDKEHTLFKKNVECGHCK